MPSKLKRWGYIIHKQRNKNLPNIYRKILGHILIPPSFIPLILFSFHSFIHFLPHFSISPSTGARRSPLLAPSKNSGCFFRPPLNVVFSKVCTPAETRTRASSVARTDSTPEPQVRRDEVRNGTTTTCCDEERCCKRCI